jgi:hypothetical protein
LQRCVSFFEVLLEELVMQAITERPVIARIVSCDGQELWRDVQFDRFRIRPLMRFRGRPGFIPCLAHILNLICKDVLAIARIVSCDGQELWRDVQFGEHLQYNFR